MISPFAWQGRIDAAEPGPSTRWRKSCGRAALVARLARLARLARGA